MNKVAINEQVAVTVMGFKKDLSAYPRRMEFRGSSYDFIDAGIRCLVHYGGRIAEIITVSDGASSYCLRSENRGGNWTLVSITA
jgi:hypothetical protein